MTNNKSAKVTAYLIVKAVRSRAIPSQDMLREKLRRQKIKEIADGYKTHDSCAHIRSVGNGV